MNKCTYCHELTPDEHYDWLYDLCNMCKYSLNQRVDSDKDPFDWDNT